LTMPSSSAGSIAVACTAAAGFCFNSLSERLERLIVLCFGRFIENNPMPTHTIPMIKIFFPIFLDPVLTGSVFLGLTFIPDSLLRGRNVFRPRNPEERSDEGSQDPSALRASG